MQTYILRHPKAVEPQSPKQNLVSTTPLPPRLPEREEAQLQATAATILGRPAAACGPTLCVGLDVHNDSIAVSLAPSGTTEVRRDGSRVERADAAAPTLQTSHGPSAEEIPRGGGGAGAGIERVRVGDRQDGQPASSQARRRANLKGFSAGRREDKDKDKDKDHL